jgi:hypothetical protein
MSYYHHFAATHFQLVAILPEKANGNDHGYRDYGNVCEHIDASSPSGIP